MYTVKFWSKGFDETTKKSLIVVPGGMASSAIVERLIFKKPDKNQRPLIEFDATAKANYFQVRIISIKHL